MFKFLWQTSCKTICGIIFAGIAGELCSAGLIATVNAAAVLELPAQVLAQVRD